MTRRILLTTSTFPQREGDALPRFVYDLAQALAQRYEVVAAAPHAPGLPLSETMGQVQVERFTYFWPRGWQKLAYGAGMRGNMQHSLLARIQPPFYVAALSRTLKRMLASGAFDLVNSHWLLPNAFAAARIQQGARPFPHVVTIHGGDMALVRKLPGGEWATRYVARRCGAMMVSGSHIAGHVQHIVEEPPPVRVQPMGTHAQRFAPVAHETPPNQPFDDGYILFVGRLIAIKGADILLKALPALLDEAPGMGVLLAGYGPLEPRLKKLAAELGVEGHVRFLGRQPHENIARYLRHARAVVVPSIIHEGESEGMPTVVSEAMAAGALVIASASGGIPDVVQDGGNGFLFEPGDPAALAETLIYALRLDAAERERIRARALETGQRLDWTAVAARYAEVFDAVISGRPLA